MLKSVERLVKKLLTWLIKIFINNDKFFSDDLNPLLIERLIIIHLDRKIGNLILSTPLIENTKNVFVNTSIDILIPYQVKVLLESNPYLSNIIEFDHNRFVKNPFRFLKLIQLLRKGNYTVAIESSNPKGTSFLNGFVTYLTNAKYRIGFIGGSGELFTNIHVIPDKNEHYYIAKQKLVNSFSNRNFTYKPKIFTDSEQVKQIRKSILGKYNLQNNAKIIGIWIGARDNKKWDLSNFKLVYKDILSQTKYFPILLFGIEEKADFNAIDSEIFNVIYSDDLGNLKNIISCCNIFISGDTGPLHYAYALGVYTVGIFLQDNDNTYGYTDGKNNFIIKPNKTEFVIKDIIKICLLLNR